MSNKENTFELIHSGSIGFDADLAKKALEAIEGVLIDLCGASPLASHSEAIYKFAHIGVGNCNVAHQDWIQQLLTHHKALKNRKVI